MRAFVFTDRALEQHAGRFVWLEINTDLEKNAGFLEQYPLDNWPTLFIVDARTEKALVRFAGSTTVPQLVKLLDDGERAWRGEAGGPEGLLARGDALYGEGKAAEAADVLARALAEAPGGWERRGRALESLMTALYGSQQYERCARTALAELPRIPRSPHAAATANWGLTCALQVSKDVADAPALREGLEARARDALGEPRIPMAADDRSGLYEMLVSAREEAGDEPGQKRVAAEWLAFLEGEAAKAPNPDARAVFDSHRMSAAIALGDPMRAVPAIEQSEKDLPRDYNPPARLATLYRLLGRLDDALRESDRALTLVQGSRRLRVLNDRSEIFLARKDTAGAVRTLEEALKVADSLPQAQVSPRTRAALAQKLARLKAAPAATPQ